MRIPVRNQCVKKHCFSRKANRTIDNIQLPKSLPQFSLLRHWLKKATKVLSPHFSIICLPWKKKYIRTNSKPVTRIQEKLFAPHFATILNESTDPPSTSSAEKANKSSLGRSPEIENKNPPKTKMRIHQLHRRCGWETTSSSVTENIQFSVFAREAQSFTVYLSSCNSPNSIDRRVATRLQRKYL